MDNQVPSLQQYCYDLLAQYAGYIEDIGQLYISSIREICVRSDPFGLAHIESMLSGTEDLSEIWQTLYTSSPESFATSLNQYVQGPNFYKQAILSSTLAKQLKSDEMDDEDLFRLLSFCSSLKIAEFNSITRLNLDTIFSSFSCLVHFSLSGSRVGASSVEPLKTLINRNGFLQSLNLNNCRLQDDSVISLLDPVKYSIITRFVVSWNDLSLVSVNALFNLSTVHLTLCEIDISKSLKRSDIVGCFKLIKKVKSQKKINIIYT